MGQRDADETITGMAMSQQTAVSRLLQIHVAALQLGQTLQQVTLGSEAVIRGFNGGESIAK